METNLVEENKLLKKQLFDAKESADSAWKSARAIDKSRMETEAENRTLKATNWHLKSIKDEKLLAAQLRIKQLREALETYSNRFEQNTAFKALALTDSTAELDAVMRDAQSWRDFQKGLPLRENLFLTMKNTDLTGKEQP